MCTLSLAKERRLLQLAVVVLAGVPVAVGFAGIAHGLQAFDAHATVSRSGDSHLRYLSGLMLATGLAFWATVRGIEEQRARFRLLTALVVVGGLGRLYALGLAGLPSGSMVAGLVIELVVAPSLALWREGLERRSGARAGIG